MPTPTHLTAWWRMQRGAFVAGKMFKPCRQDCAHTHSFVRQLTHVPHFCGIPLGFLSCSLYRLHHLLENLTEQMRTALRKMAGLRRVMGAGGHLDEGHRKLWAAELLVLQPILLENEGKKDGTVLLDENDPNRFHVEVFTENALRVFIKNMIFRKKPVFLTSAPPRMRGAGPKIPPPPQQATMGTTAPQREQGIVTKTLHRPDRGPRAQLHPRVCQGCVRCARKPPTQLRTSGARQDDARPQERRTFTQALDRRVALFAAHLLRTVPRRHQTQNISSEPSPALNDTPATA